MQELSSWECGFFPPFYYIGLVRILLSLKKTIPLFPPVTKDNGSKKWQLTSGLTGQESFCGGGSGPLSVTDGSAGFSPREVASTQRAGRRGRKCAGGWGLVALPVDMGRRGQPHRAPAWRSHLGCGEGGQGGDPAPHSICSGRTMIWGKGSRVKVVQQVPACGRCPRVDRGQLGCCPILEASRPLGRREFHWANCIHVSHVTKFCPPRSLFLEGCFNPRKGLLGMAVPLVLGKQPSWKGVGPLFRPCRLGPVPTSPTPRSPLGPSLVFHRGCFMPLLPRVPPVVAQAPSLKWH